MLDRRAFLTGTALSSAAALPEGWETGAANSDAELLAAWNGFVKACRARDDSAEDWTEVEDDAHTPVVDSFRAALEEFPASTAAGLAVKLRYLFASSCGSVAAFAAAVYGAPITDDMLADPCDRMLWGMIEDAECMAGIIR